VADLARTSTDPDERTDFFERGAGCREHRVTSGTDWTEMRIGENAWFRFGATAKRVLEGGIPKAGAQYLLF